MAITYGKVNLATRDNVVGNRREVATDITLDSSYPSGGYALTGANLGLDIELDYVIATATNTGHDFVYDYANSKLRAFVSGSEVTAATNLSTVVARLVARGKGLGRPLA